MERLRALLADRDFFKGGTFLDFEPLPFLLDPELLIKGVVAEKCVLFSRYLRPNLATGGTGRQFIIFDNQLRMFCISFRHEEK
jgi:hypothetical protein